jgi:hypothetical protein
MLDKSNDNCIATKRCWEADHDPLTSLSARPAERKGIRHRRKLVGDAIRRQTAKNEETPVRNNDVPLLEQAIVHGHLGGNALGLDGVRWLSLHAARLRGNRHAGSDHGRHQGDGQQEFQSAH